MLDGHRYIITLTSTDPRTLPRPRVMWRDDDQAAIDAAVRELRRHRNIYATATRFDGWRVRKSTPGNRDGVLIAEVRPGYDSRKVATQRASQSRTPPF